MCIRIFSLGIALGFGLTTPLSGIMTLEIEEVGSDVVLSYTGSWDAWTNNGALNNTLGQVASIFFYSIGGSSDRYFVGSGAISTDSTSWDPNYLTGGSVAGDSFGFDTSAFYAPVGYVAGGSISGTLTFSGQTLQTMNFSPGDSGSINAAGNTINFQVVPEPSTCAAIFGFVGLGFALGHRPRTAQKR